jgi:hypothetical protein
MGLRDAVPSARFQAAMALRIHVREGRLKWVSLLTWAGVDPRVSVPDLEYEPANENLGSALEDAVKYSRIGSCGGLESIPRGTIRARCWERECWMCRSPELVRLLIEAGANPIFGEGDRNPMQSLVRNFEWSFEPMFTGREPRGAMECLKIAAAAGGR